MRGWRNVFAACAWFCVAAAQFNTKTNFRPSPQQPQPPAPPPDSGVQCKCSGVINREMDCSNRGRSKVSSKDLCSGRTTKADLSRNKFVAFPASWGSYITQVNISHNQLTTLPRAPPLNTKTSVLDVSFNNIVYSSDELRPLSSLEKLFVTGNQLQSLSFLPKPCALRKLFADRNKLGSIQGPLNGCEKLEKLELSGNQLESLPRNALSGLKKLTYLSLALAKLSNIVTGSFDDLKELEVLDLSGNYFTTLPSGLFSSLKELEKLILDNNEITSLPQGVFTGLKKIEIISLRLNKLVTLPFGIFSGLNDLKAIYLHQNSLKSIPADAFSGLQKLEVIELLRNQLEILPPKLFSGLHSIKRIILFNNKLTTLPPDLLSGITSLDILDLSSNQLTALPPGLFRSLKSIKTLDLSYNRLTTFSGSDLAGPKSIVRLNLSFNKLSSLPHLDASWPAVEEVKLQGNRIEEASESALRSWLRDGDKKLKVLLGEETPLRALSSLHWALGEKKITTTTTVKCSCGALKRGESEVSFCVAVSCPGKVNNWVEAVRQSSSSANVKG